MNRIPASARHCLALMLLSAAPKVWAQTVSDTPPQKETDEIVLSPFVVTAEDDKGYRSTNTLAGTRLRTDLKDIGSAVSIINSQFLQDTDSRSNADLLKYTVNTEVGGVGGNFTGVGNGRQVNENANLLRPESNTRVRGLTSADNTRDFFLTEIPWDSYNTDRVDIQRGPNAILFGFGSPAGIINTGTVQAAFKDSNKVEFRTDSYGSARGTLDINKVLLPDELAIRIDGLDEENKYRQDPAFERQERTYAALRYDPAFLKKHGMETSFRANFEQGDIQADRPRSMPPVDQITPWFTDMNHATFNPYRVWNQDDSMRAALLQTAGGGPNPRYNPWLGAWANNYGNVLSVYSTPDADTQSTIRAFEGNAYWGIGPTGTVPPAIAGIATANNYYGIGNPGAWDRGIGGLAFAQQVGIVGYATYADDVMTPTATDPLHQGLPYKSLGAYKDKEISNPGIFDYYNNLLDGYNKHEAQGYHSYNLNLSQTFFNNRLGFEVVYDNQNYHEYQKNGVQPNLMIDIDTYNLDVAAQPSGVPTPGFPGNVHVGEAMVKSDGTSYRYWSGQKAKRITAFGELRAEDFLSRGWLTNILGRHVFTGLYSTEEKETKNLYFYQNAFDDTYQYLTTGTEVQNLGARSVPVLVYLSGDLSGVNDPNALHLSRVTGNLEPQLQNGQFYAFDSHWKWPSDPTQPGYVDPSAYWANPNDTSAVGSTQAENPDNYKGWSLENGKLLSAEKGEEGELYYSGLKTWRQVRSTAVVWQGYMFDNLVVPMIGLRRDSYKGGNAQGPVNADNVLDASNPAWKVNRNVGTIAGDSKTYSIVVHTPKFISEKLPLGTHFDVFYNHSENFKPTPGDVDIYGQPLANPTGRTKDYGFVVSTWDDRISLKVNWYETKVSNDRLQGFEYWRLGQTFATMLGSAYRVRAKDPANSWKWDYSAWTAYGGQAEADKGAQAVLDAYNNNAVFKDFVDGWQMTAAMTSENGNYVQPPGISASTDTISKGTEFELSAEPIKGWSTSVNLAHTSATQTNIGGALKDFISTMEPIFQGPAGDLRQWWAGDGNNFRTLWSSQIQSQYNTLVAQEGTDVPELRPWRFNVVSTYTFQRGSLKNLFAGVGYRWEDSVVVGYPVTMGKDAITGDSVLVYDVAHPYRGPADTHFDFWVGYSHKITKTINWKIQLNVRDLFASKKLIPVSVEPDGTAATYRIPDGTSWALTNTLEF